MAVSESELRSGGTAGPDLVTVAPMRRRHLRAVVRIEQASNPRPWSLGLFASELRYSDSRVYLVATKGGRVVGHAGLMLVVGDGHVTTISVDPAHRRTGVATRLLCVLARRAVAEGAAALTLEVRASNVGAQELYQRFGFAPAGVRANYYTDPTEDALVMWANDVDGGAYRRRLALLEDELPNPTILDGLS